MRIVVTQLDGTEYEFECVSQETISQLKDRIFECTTHPPCSQMLLFNSDMLMDETSTLMDVGVGNESRLQLVIQRASTSAICPGTPAGDGSDFCKDLLMSSIRGHDQCTRTLIEAEANVNESTRYQSALMASCQYGHDQCTRALIKAKADLEQRSLAGFTETTFHFGRGFTALMFACTTGHDQCTQVLLEAKADFDARAYTQRAPNALELAREEKNDSCIRALKKAGAKNPQHCCICS